MSTINGFDIPKIVISLDQGVVWEVFSNVDISVVCENLDVMRVHRVDTYHGEDVIKKIQELEFLADNCKLTKFDLIDMLKKKRYP